MAKKILITWDEIYTKIKTLREVLMKQHYKKDGLKIYGIPRGGNIICGLMCMDYYYLEITHNPKEADIFLDDILDSGKTYNKYTQKYKKPFLTLVNKSFDYPEDVWIVFPWEGEDEEKDIDDYVARISQYCNHNRLDIERLLGKFLKSKK